MNIKKNIELKIVIPNNLTRANHDELRPLFEKARLVKINIPSDSSRDMTVFVSPESMESSSDNFIIYDFPTSMNSSIEAIEMVNPRKDIRELLSEKEVINFRKSILIKLNTVNDEHFIGINRLVTIIDIDEFKKDFMMD